MLAPPRKYQCSGRSSGSGWPAASLIAAAPKPGSAMALARAMKKVSMPMAWPSGVFAAIGSTTGQRAVQALVGTPFHAEVQPQLSYISESGTM